MTQAITAIQSEDLKGTYILQSTVILAILIYQWISDQELGQCGRQLASEPNRKGNHDLLLTDPGWITFLAYFPAFLLLHETHRLDAYCQMDSFDFTHMAYQNDISQYAGTFSRPKAAEQHSIYQNSMLSTALLEEIKDSNPTTYLTPAMLEGPALSGPYLLQHIDGIQDGAMYELNLGELHCQLGWRSIWNMSLPMISFKVKYIRM